MNKILLGLLIGAALGAVDGCTAWFYPEVRAQLAGIIVGYATQKYGAAPATAR